MGFPDFVTLFDSDRHPVTGVYVGGVQREPLIGIRIRHFYSTNVAITLTPVIARGMVSSTFFTLPPDPDVLRDLAARMLEAADDLDKRLRIQRAHSVQDSSGDA